jgi:hypothetical protein
MSKPYVREDRALSTWITFPSEQLRRAYVQASAAILSATPDDAQRVRRLRALIAACGGKEQAAEPKGD